MAIRLPQKSFAHLCGFLLFIGCSLPALAQRMSISGTVYSEDRQPLSGVTINVKGDNISTVSDNDGTWKLSVPAGNPTIVFSYVGYVTRQEFLKGRQVLNIVLSSANKALEDVVIMGYSTQKRRDLTGAVSSVNARQLKDIPVNSAAEALAGRLAGVKITSSEGKPGADFTIVVRGGGSITQDNSPLYVIDGIQVENGLASLAPQDIESVDVLKDAAATAIYGARGANGVVVITTKGGHEGRTTVNYNGMVGQHRLAKELPVLDPYQFVLYQYERTRGSTDDSTNFAQLYGSDLNKYKTVPFVDWQDKTFGRDAWVQSHNVSISGGSRNTQMNLSLTDNQEDGIMINSGFERKLVSFRLDHKANDKLKVGFNMRYNDQVLTGAGSSDEGTSTYNNLRHSVRYRPFLSDSIDNAAQYDPDYYDATNAGNALGLINPIQLSNAQYRKNYTKVTNISGYLNYTFSPLLSFKGTVGMDYNAQTRNSFDDTITSNSRINGASLPLVEVITADKTTFNNSNVLTFSTSSLRKSSVFDVLVGNEFYNINTASTDNQLRYFPKGITAEKALGQFALGTPVPLYPRNTAAASRLVSFFSRMNYSYKGKYLASASLRADGSSKFTEDKQWGYFPSGSVAWRISQEPFMERYGAISDLKLRLSYGQSGNNRIDDYLYSTTYTSTGQYALNDQLVAGYVAPYLANKNLKWETTISRNLGLDLGLFNNRLQASVDVYRNTSNNLLINSPIATTTGYSSQLQNIGSTTNKGVEVQLSGTVLQKKTLSWTASFNISFNKNRVDKLASFEQYYLENSGFGTVTQPADFIVKVGKPVGSMYGYVYDGIYKTSDFDYNSSNSQYTLKKGVVDGSKTLGISQPGWMKLKDLNGDGIIDDNDKTVIGNANPKFSGGLNQQLTYKNFDFSIFVNFVYGNTIYNANKIEFDNGYGANTNLLANMKDRWRTIDANGNQVQKVETLSGGQQVVTGIPPDQLSALNRNAKMWIPISGAGAFYTTSWAMEDGSYLRINNITLGYTLPRKLTQRFKIVKLRVYGTVNNVAILTGYTGYDPDVNTRRATPVTPGVDYAAYPRSRAFLLGVNLSL
ncbi:MAG TPA: TonB-dependent receptor [Puia sp.]|jgi:TonB-linked SusC/RagA family outer membrane protein